VLYQGNRVDIPLLDTWPRGYAWAIHGFTTAFEETGETRFLNAAKTGRGFLHQPGPLGLRALLVFSDQRIASQSAH
jgi:hypothetical protein